LTTNRLSKSESPVTRSAQEWAERGNRILSGQEPMKGDVYMYRNDVRWFVRDGRCAIEMAR
jgi:hypothetical protein